MYTRILVASDGSETAGRAVDRAVDVAGRLGAHLTVLTAASDLERARETAEAEAARHAGSGVVIDTLVSPVDAASAIVQAAEAGGYDLVVVGNKGMTGARRFIPIGSVPNKVSHHLATSLLIVHTT